MAEKPVKEMDKHDSASTGEPMGIRHIPARVYAADAVCDAYGEDKKGGEIMIRYIRCAIAVIGFALIIGAAGGCDTDILTLGQAAVRAVIGLAMVGAIALTQKEKAADDLQIDNGAKR